MKKGFRGQRTEDRGPRTAERGPYFRPPLPVLCLLFSVLCFSGGCGGSEAARAYARAEQAEQQFTVERAPAIIAEYRRVAALAPGSDWAKKSAERIKALEARVQAEEMHKHVFQEHGVD
jgi:hypothetical protein